MDTKKVLVWLQQAQWKQNGPCGDVVCPECGVWRPKGEQRVHRPDCELAALIAEAEQEAQTGGATITHLDTAAHQHVESMLPRADGTQGPYLWWHGWAIRDAFVAGAKWQEGNVAQAGGWKPRSEAVYAILFDDADRQPEIFIGEEAATERFSLLSVSWNAHLFVKVQSNSRDERYFLNNLPPLPEQAAGKAAGS